MSLSLQVKRRGIFSSMPKAGLRNSKTEGFRVSIGAGVGVDVAVGGNGVGGGASCVWVADGGTAEGGCDVGIGDLVEEHPTVTRTISVARKDFFQLLIASSFFAGFSRSV